MIASITGVILWLVQNPQIVSQGEQVVVDAVKAAIATWDSFTSGALTTDQLQAEWTAQGIDMAAVEAAADKAGL